MRLSTNNIFLFAVILLSIGCRRTNEPITFRPHSSTAILVGDENELAYGDSKNLEVQEGDLVEIVAVSDGTFNLTDDECEKFKAVKVIFNDKEYLLNGRSVYEIVVNSQNIDWKAGGDVLEVRVTNFYGVGPWNDDGLTFCSSYKQPLFLSFNDSIKGLAEVINNETFIKQSFNDNFRFFELAANDASYDYIKSISGKRGEWVLNIHRELQEGFVDYVVKVKLKGKVFEAEILEYGDVYY